MRALLSLIAVTFVTQLAFAEGVPAKEWYEEGFEANSPKDKKVDAMRAMIANPPRLNWHKCTAIKSTQIKFSQLYVERGTDKNPVNCNEDTDCGIGSLGGFCAVPAHKSQLEGYALYTRSDIFKGLDKEWKAEKCVSPVGMCMPVSKVFCEKPAKDKPGVCKGKWDKDATAEPVFMSAAK